MQRSWAVAWRNLRRNRRRNLATGAAIAFGYAGLVILGGYADRVDHFLMTNTVYLQHSGHVAVWMHSGLDRATSEPLKYQLDAETQKKVLAWAEKDARVEFSARYLRGMGLAGNSCATHPTAIFGMEPAVLGRIVRHPEVKRWSEEIAQPIKGKWMDAFPDVENAVAVSAGLAELLQKPRVHDETRGLPAAPTLLACDTPAEKEQLALDANVQLVSLTYDGIFSGVDTEMVATFHWPEAGGEDGTMYAPLSTVQKLYDTDRVTYVAMFLHRSTDAKAFAADLQAAMDREGLKVDAMAYDDERLNPYYVGTMAFLNSMVGFITILVTMVLVLTVAGAMTLAILERTRELGTWRALGFGRGALIGLMVREAVVLSALGLAAGITLGLTAAAGVNAANIRFSPPGVPGTIALLIIPAVKTCLIQAAFIVPGVSLAAWLVVRSQMQRNVVEMLTSQSG